MLLGDMGADVICVEPPPGVHGPGDIPSRVALNIGRSKRSIALDLTKPQAREIAYAIARRSDVVCQNYRPGVAEKLGMDLNSFLRVNPDLIYSRVSAFGDAGPESYRPGFDLVAQAGAGTMIPGPDGDLPVAQRSPIGDVTASCLEVIGILAAVYHHEKTGEGQAVGTSLLAGAVLQNVLRLVSVEDADREWRSVTLAKARDQVAAGGSYQDAVRLTATSRGGEPTRNPDRETPLGEIYYRSFRTRNGHIAVGCLNTRQQQRLNNTLELHDPRFEPAVASNVKPRGPSIGTMKSTAEAWFASRDTDQALSTLEAADIACGPVRTLLETFDAAQLLENSYVIEHDHPVMGICKLLGFPIAFGQTPMRIARPAPATGADAEELLSWLGYTSDEVAQLRAQRVLF